MASLPYSQIEYSFTDGKPGRAWNFLRGCANGPDICKTRGLCWAKAMADRFRGGDFTPTLDIDAFNQSFPRRPSNVLTCFTGDLSWADIEIRSWAILRIANAPQHTFILLTKRPAEAYHALVWPRNAILGVSLTGAETPERQQQVMDDLRAVQGRHRLWVSYEPSLGPLAVKLDGVSWVVIGPQTGKGAENFDIRWYSDVFREARRVGAAIWEKQVLLDEAGWNELTQEFPEMEAE